jgi:hypothetical protein
MAQKLYGPTLSHEQMLEILRAEDKEPWWPWSILIVFHPDFLEHMRHLRMDLFTPFDPSDLVRIERARKLLAEIGDAIALRPCERKQGKPKTPVFLRALKSRKRKDRERFARLLQKTAILVDRHEKRERQRTVPPNSTLATAIGNLSDLLALDLAKAFEKQAEAFLKAPAHRRLIQCGPRIRSELDLARALVSRGLALLRTTRRSGPRRFKEISSLWEPGTWTLLPERPQRGSKRK